MPAPLNQEVHPGLWVFAVHHAALMFGGTWETTCYSPHRPRFPAIHDA
ncbi:hypothetical protein CPL00345_CDS0094 [Klebsiella phage GlastoCabaret]